jgi:exosortase
MSNLRVWVRSTLATVATEASYARMETEAWLAQGLQLAIVLLLVASLYFTILVNLGRQWATDPDFSHGFFVPLFSAFVVWQKREPLARIGLRPSWFGLPIIAAGLLTLIVGILGAELFLSRSSSILVVAGLIVFFAGWRFFGAVFFAWVILFLMIPIPAVLYNQITLPLQFFASKFATSLLVFAGVPVLREGNIIQLPALTLEVVEACSGIRSLISLETLAIFVGYFWKAPVWERIALAFSAVPIAVVANGLRIMVTGLLVQYWDPAKAEGFFHSFSGVVIFVLSVGMLVLLHRLTGMVTRWRGAAA